MDDPSTPLVARAWPHLIVGIVCMIMIANLQYGWTLFVGPIDAKYHWGRGSEAAYRLNEPAIRAAAD